MAEYIKRDAIKARLEDLVDWCQDLRKPGLEQALAMLNEEPVADVATVVHGVWVCVNKIDPISGYRCSKCRRRVGFDLTPYCPNCGAKMDGGDSDATD
uniref:Zinc-ribbon containing domain protein n=1 Tax=Siphoviridae sp. ctdau33 TaxID=2827902 RepID=A0A8S5S6E2_9CAUD|nr:MAG TPA: zinc-ribbon containing domain protein [Caudoviricetes sp.]DAF46504.1 MAG TPA: zinc-ribbon containing domain protein [Siphoviridae sp. ctdau33]